MKVGDVIMACPTIDGLTVHMANLPELCPATVVYIHPQRRFYTVEFEISGRKMRESFAFKYRASAKYQGKR